MYKFILTATLGLLIYLANAQNCSNKKYCGENALGEKYDYRGQSTFGKIVPGDTIRIKVILYGRNTYRIAVCSDESLGDVSFRVLNTVREYVRQPARVEKISVQEPIYKKNEKGELLPIRDDWGEVVYDEYGDLKYEIETFKTVIKTDTVWNTQRNIVDYEIFSSNSGNNRKLYYEENTQKTKSITIEVIAPVAKDESLAATESCLSIMVGRKITQ